MKQRPWLHESNIKPMTVYKCRCMGDIYDYLKDKRVHMTSLKNGDLLAFYV